MSDLKRLNLLNKCRTFIFDLPYFLYLFGHWIIQYLIKKLSMVKNIPQEGYIVVALSTYVRMSKSANFPHKPGFCNSLSHSIGHTNFRLLIILEYFVIMISLDIIFQIILPFQDQRFECESW